VDSVLAVPCLPNYQIRVIRTYSTFDFKANVSILRKSDNKIGLAGGLCDLGVMSFEMEKHMIVIPQFVSCLIVYPLFSRGAMVQVGLGQDWGKHLGHKSDS
jgi:hypothetical protein